MSDDIAIKAAEILGLDAGYVLACVTAERAKNTPSYETWVKICERLTPKKRREAA
ncbi:hypothetical protein [Spongiibacter sp.]|uniref:hypothetical protein n=1 Tax=Spongiibacter sp. TaxID=2024860 RepID=UPI00257C044D|nr:hypothetical protein [Spongiibacter sp.]